jgi:hypothetical protein
MTIPIGKRIHQMELIKSMIIWRIGVAIRKYMRKMDPITASNPNNLSRSSLSNPPKQSPMALSRMSFTENDPFERNSVANQEFVDYRIK